MDKTTTAPPKTGDFERKSEPTAAAPPPTAPPPSLRTIQRRWPRTVPDTRVFPRG